ncbi:MAG: hypothetical protein KJ737_18360 [Proteobacteria bacterium]|nr:hypothetical protein [Pseudomonadota bacterium]
MKKGRWFVIILFFFVWGCSAFRPPKQVISIRCNEPQAVAYVNGEPFAVPNEIVVDRNKNVSISCNKRGFHPYNKVVGYHFNLTGALDLAGTFIIVVPVVGLLTPGIWSLNETEIEIELLPVQYEGGNGG